jgi:hypothetical protein
MYLSKILPLASSQVQCRSRVIVRAWEITRFDRSLVITSKLRHMAMTHGNRAIDHIVVIDRSRVGVEFQVLLIEPQ